MLTNNLKKTAGPLGRQVRKVFTDPGLRAEAKSGIINTLQKQRSLNNMGRKIMGGTDHVSGLKRRAIDKLVRAGKTRQEAIESVVDMDKNELYGTLGMRPVANTSHRTVNPWTGTHGASLKKTGSFVGGFEKVALKISDIEQHLGIYLDKRHEEDAEKYIAQEKAERLGLRHPWLTGIPTLGIWPAISKERAAAEVAAKLLRRDPALRADLNELRASSHQREVDLMQQRIAEQEAQSRERMMMTGVLGGLSAIDKLKRNDD